MKIDENGVNRNVYGVNTSLKSKPEMFLHAKRIFLDRLFTVRSQALYDQILEYPSDDVNLIRKKDGSGGHFDLLMALMIGLYKAQAISVNTNDEAVDRRLRKMTDDIFKESVETR